MISHLLADLSTTQTQMILQNAIAPRPIAFVSTIDEAGNIISDAKLTVTNVAFDDIQLGHMLTEKATYAHDFNGTGVMGQHKFYGEMGCNGTVSLKFSTPIYLWLLEHM